MDDVALDHWFELLDSLDVAADAERLYDPATPDGAVRRRNLRRYFKLMAEKRPTMMLLGEAPGYRGTAVTGIPFMSLRQLASEPGLLTGENSGDGFTEPREGCSTWEATSGAMWQTLGRLAEPVPLLWASYPNHPFEAGDPQSNRKPRPSEVADGITVALALAAVFGIERIVAVGRVAQAALNANGLEVAAVRHPARGGAREFEKQLLELMA